LTGKQRKKQPRHQTTNPKACFGLNQQLILLLLRKGPRGKRDLKDDFINTLFQERPIEGGHGGHRELGGFRFDQAIRTLRKRGLIQTVVFDVAAIGHDDPTLNLTKDGDDIINRKASAAKERIIVRILNDLIRAKRKDVSTAEVIGELAKLRITGERKNWQMVGRVLHKHSVTHCVVSNQDQFGKQHRTTQYLLPEKPIILSVSPKRFKPNYKKKSSQAVEAFVFFD
jgi:hypothetical protein